MTLLGNIKSKTAKHENGKMASCYKITEVVLVHHNIIKNYYQ